MSILKPTDYIFYGHGSPPQDEILFKNYFSNYSDGLSVECGAATAGIGTHFFEAYLNWTCINIEPSKYSFKSLVNYRPNSVNLNLALSNKNGKAIFKDIISAPGGGHDNGSLEHTESHMKELLGYKCRFEDYEVETLTYATLQDNFNKPIDLLVLDVEGYELKVIEGMKKSKFLPLVICIEYPIAGLKNIQLLLEGFGYKLDFVNHNNAYFSMPSFIGVRNSWFGATERIDDYN